jgi:outer membrane protein assembly factor BamB
MKLLFSVLAAISSSLIVQAEDWPRFRGPQGNGVSADTKAQLTWSDKDNLKWKIALPGPGSSSPITSGDRVFLTCYSGYGTNRSDVENISALKRHLLCIDRATGKVIWEKQVKAAQPEDPFRGYLTEHGYASHTPVTDGKTVFAFYGKSGALAYDAKTGKELWKVSLGTSSSSRRWGSASSPILYKDTVIINASDESETLYGLEKATGKIAWKVKAGGIALTFGTPGIVKAGDRDDLVIAAPHEIWGMNPDKGTLRWFCEIPMDGNVSPSILADKGVVYAFGGYRTRGSVAVRAGGEDDVTKSHLVWKTRTSSYVPSPVLHEGHLFWMDERGNAFCAEAKTGKVLYEKEIIGPSRNRPVYASPVLVNGRIFCVTRKRGTYVFAAQPEFKQLANNRFANDESDFNASPAVSDGQIFIRSNQFLYCIEE